MQEEDRERNGHYASNREVCVLADPLLMRPCSPRTAASMLTKFQQVPASSTKKFAIVVKQQSTEVDPRAIQFTRCAFQDGGAVAAQKSLEKGTVSEFEVVA
jgi:hypothetical protein